MGRILWSQFILCFALNSLSPVMNCYPFVLFVVMFLFPSPDDAVASKHSGLPAHDSSTSQHMSNTRPAKRLLQASTTKEEDDGERGWSLPAPSRSQINRSFLWNVLEGIKKNKVLISERDPVKAATATKPATATESVTTPEIKRVPRRVIKPANKVIHGKTGIISKKTAWAFFESLGFTTLRMSRPKLLGP